MNQDSLENLFSVFRQRGGYNKNPTAKTLRTSFRSNCIYSLCTSNATNCESNLDYDESKQFEEVQSDTQIANFPPDRLSSSSSSSSSHSSTPKEFSLPSFNVLDTNNVKPLITLEDCSVVYFSGYLAHKCIAKFNCENCKNSLLTNKDINDKKQMLLLNKNYTTSEVDCNESGLKAPSTEFNNVINKALNIFEKNIDNILYKRKIKYKLMNIFEKDYVIIKWIAEKNTCREHRLQILEKLLICKIFKKAKTISTTSNQAKLAKLKILNHV